GEPVSLPAKYVPHFKPGKQLRERVDEARLASPIQESPGGDDD
ncbi:MAG TPA: HU family DNA-binding protein, partial [Gammaproteobacteria bacterium]